MLLIIIYILFLVILLGWYYRRSINLANQYILYNNLAKHNKNNITPVLSFVVPFCLYSFVGLLDRVVLQEYTAYERGIFTLCCILGIVSFLYGYGFDVSTIKKPETVQCYRKKNHINIQDALITFVFLSTIALNMDSFISMITNFGSGTAYHDYAVRDARSDFSGVASALNSYYNLLILLFPFYRCFRNKKIKLFDLLIFMIVFSRSFFSGDRTNIVLAGFIFAVLINSNLYSINLKSIIVSCFFGTICLVMLGHLRYYNNFNDMLNMILNNNIFMFISLQRSGEFYYTTGTLMNYIHSININERFFDFGLIYLRDFVMFIPTFIFHDRPLPSAEQYMIDFFPFAEAGTGHAWFILDNGYISLGLFGIIIEMTLYGKLLKIIYKKYFDNIEDPLKCYIYVLFLLAVFYSIRSSVILSIKNFLISILPILIIKIISKCFSDTLNKKTSIIKKKYNRRGMLWKRDLW